MKVIFSCFAGRKRYMEILSNYIDKLVKMKLVDEVHIWDYTRLESDAQWLAERWGEKVYRVEDKSTYSEYYSYYNKERYPEDDTILIKCDDDIVYIDVDNFSSFVQARRESSVPFFFSPLIINNPTCSAIIHNLFKGIDFSGQHLMSPEHAKTIHEMFLNDELSNYNGERFHHMIPNDRAFNINFICMLSKDFDVFSNKRVHTSDEIMLSVVAPNYFKRQITVDCKFIVAHMAFTNQRNNGFDESELLEKYRIKELVSRNTNE